MEEIIQNNQSNEEKTDLIITNEIKNHLLIYAKWGKFFGILAYIGATLMFVLSFLYLFLDAFTSTFHILGLRYMNIISFIFFLAFAVLYAIGANLILQSVKSTKTGIFQNNQLEIENGTRKLACLMKFMGITTIIGICLYIVFIVFITTFTAINAMQAF